MNNSDYSVKRTPLKDCNWIRRRRKLALQQKGPQAWRATLAHWMEKARPISSYHQWVVNDPTGCNWPISYSSWQFNKYLSVHTNDESRTKSFSEHIKTIITFPSTYSELKSIPSIGWGGGRRPHDTQDFDSKCDYWNRHLITWFIFSKIDLNPDSCFLE